MDNKQLNDEIDDAVTDPVERLLHGKKPASSGKGLAILALLLALAAAAGSGWQAWQAYSADAEGISQQQALIHLQEEQAGMARSLQSYGAQLDASGSGVDPGEFTRLGEQFKALEQNIAGLQGQSGEDMASMSAVQGSVRSIEQRLSTVESGLTSVAANSLNSSVKLDIAEIDFLLRAANERLQLFSDPGAADLALQAADVHIEALQDPMFLSVRQRIAASRQALAAVPRVDRVQLSARFTQLQNNLTGLPFQGESVAEPEPELAADAGWWQSLKHSLSSLVTVRRRVPEDGAALSLDDKDYLRQGLWLQLESARLALMRSDSEVYASSLERVDSTLEQFFEDGSSAVQSFLLEVTAMQQLQIAPEMPDISGPWTQLRQLRDSRRLLQSAPAIEDSVE